MKTAPTRQDDATRKNIIRGVYLIFLMYMLEGALRKWALPNLATPLIFLRDPMVIALYLYALFRGAFSKRDATSSFLVVAAAFSAFGAIQYFFNQLAFSGFLLGLRAYWLYMPMTILIATQFTKDEVYRFIRFILLCALPNAVVVALQYNAGRSDWINVGIGGDDDAALSLADGIVRPFGLFTFSGPNVQFTALAVAALVAAFYFRRSIKLGKILFATATIAIITMSILTGSRGIYFQVGFIAAFTLVCIFLLRPNLTSAATAIGLVVLATMAGYVFSAVFPDMLYAMTERFGEAERSEGSIWDRAFAVVTAGAAGLDSATILGGGLGAGASGVSQYLGLGQLPFGENELERNIVELGIIAGPAFLLFRAALSLYLLVTSMKAARSGHLAVLPLAGFAIPCVLFGQMTFSPLYAFPAWICIGLILALGGRNFEKPTATAQHSAPPAAKRP